MMMMIAATSAWSNRNHRQTNKQTSWRLHYKYPVKMLVHKLHQLILLATLVVGTHGFFDFFIDTNESLSLLGMPLDWFYDCRKRPTCQKWIPYKGHTGALYYAHDGVLKSKVLSIRLDMNENKNSVEYTWKAYNVCVVAFVRLLS